MDNKLIGLAAVALLVGGVLAVKHGERSPNPSATAVTDAPQILLVADMSEAGGEDGCARIIKAVQAAQQRHVRVVQFGPGDISPLITRYRVLVNPTVLLIDTDGKVSARFEGESPEIVAAVESRLAQVRPAD